MCSAPFLFKKAKAFAVSFTKTAAALCSLSFNLFNYLSLSRTPADPTVSTTNAVKGKTDAVARLEEATLPIRLSRIAGIAEECTIRCFIIERLTSVWENERKEMVSRTEKTKEFSHVQYKLFVYFFDNKIKI